MSSICRAALTTILIVFFAEIAWAQPSAVPASSASSEARPGFLVIQEDVLIPLINEPEYQTSTWRAATLRGATVLTQPRRSGLAQRF